MASGTKALRRQASADAAVLELKAWVQKRQKRKAATPGRAPSGRASFPKQGAGTS